jgi:transcriptional regulator with XRE-family HTH domain
LSDLGPISSERQTPAVSARVRAELTQAQVAERMGTSQAAVARIESGDFDVRTTTLDRYALAVGRRINYRLSAAS